MAICVLGSLLAVGTFVVRRDRRQHHPTVVELDFFDVDALRGDLAADRHGGITDPVGGDIPLLPEPPVFRKVTGSRASASVFYLPDDASMVFKTLKSPIDGAADDFGDLVEGIAVAARELTKLPILLASPQRPTTDGGRLSGYVMTRIPDRFYFDMGTGRDRRSALRELHFALPRQTTSPVPFDVNDGDRLKLVRLVGQFLEAMHRAKLAYGNVSWVKFSFTIDPVELSVHGFDRARLIGTSCFSRQGAKDVGPWNDGVVSATHSSTLDDDRYRFALLAYRLLVSKDPVGHMDEDAAAMIEGFDSTERRILARLWRRADGLPGTRPQVSEWLSVLRG